MRTRTEERCAWVPAFEVRHETGGVAVSAEQVETCTRHVLEDRSFQVKRVRHPDWVVLCAEGAILLAGISVFLAGTEQDALKGGIQTQMVGVLIAVPASIATVVDAAKYHKETERETATSDTVGLTRESRRRGAAAVRVALVFDDNRSIDAHTDGDGKAFLPIPAERWSSGDVIEARLVVGAAERRIRLTRSGSGRWIDAPSRTR